MALITCPDCTKQVSDAAPACIHCGAPLKPIEQRLAPAPKKTSIFTKVFLVLGTAFILFTFIGLAARNPQRDAVRAAAKKERCVNAITSSIGTSTTGYADKAAYEARVRQACEGLELNGKDLGQVGR